MDTLTIQPDATTEDIHFAFGTFSLGTVLVAAGTIGVAAILLGDDKRALRSELAAAFPQARRTLDHACLADMVGQVVTFLDARTRFRSAPRHSRLVPRTGGLAGLA